ncbi:hypothetical protein B0T17DRAFT_533226 [Bombardia bombarda]|uniref:Secreted protein n=1 Tax=Bombardia bombarda TaxID=252184 RepID=A0AA39WTJ0_9PEZI|nr:hypothetical protein B0T17DRAFT_533226 [Bombardia bombarda]
MIQLRKELLLLLSSLRAWRVCGLPSRYSGTYSGTLELKHRPRVKHSTYLGRQYSHQPAHHLIFPQTPHACCSLDIPS